MRKLSTPFLFTCLLAFTGLSRAQIVSVTDATSTPVPGVGHSYIQTLNETVNPGNGSVSLRLQVPTPQGRGLNVPFGFAYDSTGAHFPGGSIAGQAGWNTNSSYLSSGGWAYSLPMLSFTFGHQTIGKYSCPYYTGYVFQDGQATRYSFRTLTTPVIPPGCPDESKNTDIAGPYQTDRSGTTLVDGPEGTICDFSPNTGCGPVSGPGGTGECLIS
jgi:hypothetical protein